MLDFEFEVRKEAAKRANELGTAMFENIIAARIDFKLIHLHLLIPLRMSSGGGASGGGSKRHIAEEQRPTAAAPDGKGTRSRKRKNAERAAPKAAPSASGGKGSK